MRCAFVITSLLEKQFHSELQNSRRSGGSNSTECARGLSRGIEARRRVDTRERRMVEQIERLGAELHSGFILKSEILENGKIPLAESGPDQNVASAVTELPLHHQVGRQERRRIEPSSQGALIGRQVWIAGHRG